jgi:hypothetical protein
MTTFLCMWILSGPVIRMVVERETAAPYSSVRTGCNVRSRTVKNREPGLVAGLSKR